MLKTKPIFGFTLLLLLCGCADPADTTDLSSTVDDAVDHSHDADGHTHTDSEGHDADSGEAPVAESKSDDESKKPAHDYLPLPEGLPPQLVQAYGQIAVGAQAGDVMGLLNMAGISQEIAKQTAETDVAAADGFYKQAAVAMRAGKKLYPEELPETFVGPVLFNEALAFARESNVEGASKSLEEAVTSGFSDMEAIRSDAALADVRATEGFEAKIAEWEEVAKTKKAAAMAAEIDRAKEELAAGETFPFEFTLNDLDGKEHSLADYKGKVVIVDLWGTWCPPCRAEIPSFIKIQDELGDQGFQMIGLNYEREESDEANLKAAKDFVAEFGINYPCFMGDEKTQNQIKDLQGFPTTLFIDRAGKVRLMVVGQHEYSFLKAVVEQLLAEEAPAAE